MKKIALLAIVGLVTGCPAGFFNVCDDGVCDVLDGGPDASPDTSIDAPAGCELSKDPKDSPACIADSVGIFVDATSGLDSNDGSKLKPLKTIGSALAKVGNKPRIYICEGSYSENVKLATATSLYGGFTCGTWAADGKVVAIDATGIVVAVTTTTALRIVDLTLKAHAAAAAGSSAVGALCASGSNVTFSRVKVVADAGKDGVAGAEDATVPAQATKGTNASGNSGGVNGTCTCPDGVTTGGAGGNANTGSGNTGDPTTADGGAGGAGGLASCGTLPGGGGKDGAFGAIGNAGPGATKFGSLSDPGWTPTPGTDGTAGLRAQGGGGGGARTGGGGGAGGCGGCGGKLGGGGGGGGASLGVVSFNATVALVSCEVTTGGAGNGGVGGKGQVGQTGGNPGGDPNFVGCSGGQGGNGGPGGSGGGGAGGLSVGILWKGSAAPTIDASTTAKITVAAKGGTKGTGGTPGTNDGIDGVAQAVLEVK